MVSILLIDDNPQFRHEVRLGLEDAGYRVIEASSGDEGLNAFKRDPQDVVITNVVMDHGEGVETMRWIHDLSPDVPVIAISAHEPYTPFHGQTRRRPYPGHTLPHIGPDRSRRQR